LPCDELQVPELSVSDFSDALPSSAHPIFCQNLVLSVSIRVICGINNMAKAQPTDHADWHG